MEAIERAQRFMPEGSRIYFIIRHQTNMKRWVSFYVVVDGRITDVTGYIARVLDWKRHDNRGSSILVNGCGFNAGQQVTELVQEALKYETRFQTEQLH